MAISRADFFALTGLNTDTHTALKRRGLIPVENQADRTYTAFEALAFNLSDRLAAGPDGHNMGRGMACGIVRDCAKLLIERADDIDATAAPFIGGAALEGGAEKILAGRLILGGMKGHRPFVGTPAELATEFACEWIVDVMLTDVTTARLVLQRRAEGAGVDLASLWPNAASVPSFEEIAAERRKSWAEAMERVNARRRGDA
ncbi:hypothetical protein [Salinarimonas chemoclinalis]|uniref:hypothetical protein n=1 Tax=Salinarimonas chemoclinalis TaxID=3241599 RepID=UPI003557DECF